jgi:FAD/FMN-containing dehydrogenase
VQKKLVAAVAWPIPDYFRTLAAEIPKGSAVGLFMIGEGSQSLFAGLLEAAGGKMIYQASQKEVEASRQVPIYEYSWNHTTLQALKLNRGVTYLQTLFAGPDHLANIAAMMALFPDELSMHLEFVRLDGQICCFGIQIVNFTNEQRLAEIIAIHEAHGHKIFNPHTYVLEDGGMKQTDPDQLAFKRRADPFGLLNPGKMRGWDKLISGAA